jgi:hypothetical protein
VDDTTLLGELSWLHRRRHALETWWNNARDNAHVTVGCEPRRCTTTGTDTEQHDGKTSVEAERRDEYRRAQDECRR